MVRPVYRTQAFCDRLIAIRMNAQKACQRCRRVRADRVKHGENDLLAPGCYPLMYIKLVNFIDNSMRDALPFLAGEPVAGRVFKKRGVYRHGIWVRGTAANESAAGGALYAGKPSYAARTTYRHRHLYGCARGATFVPRPQPGRRACHP